MVNQGRAWRYVWTWPLESEPYWNIFCEAKLNTSSSTPVLWWRWIQGLSLPYVSTHELIGRQGPLFLALGLASGATCEPRISGRSLADRSSRSLVLSGSGSREADFDCSYEIS